MAELPSTNRVKISKVRETTFGVTPTSPAFKTRRVTSHGLGINPQTVVSNEIRSDRQRKDVILTAYQAGGTVAGEAAFYVMDDDLEEALQGTWAANPNQAVTALTTTTATVASGTSFKANHLALMSGFATPANNNVFQVSSSGSTTVVFPSSTFTAEASPPAAAFARVVGFAGAASDITATASGLGSTILDFTTLGLTVGMWLRVGGVAAGTQFATAALNDFVRLSAIGAHALTFDRLPSGWTTDAGTGKTIQVWMGDFLTNGSTKRSNTVERQYLDHSPVTYEYLTGQTLDKLTLAIQSGQIVTYSEDWIGASGSTTTTRVSGATDTAAPTNDVLNAASNVGRIAFNGTAISSPNYVLGATVAIANNLRRQMAVGNIAAVGIGNGEFAATLTLNTYFGDKTVLDYILNNTLTSFDFRIGRTDSNNEAYVFDFPSIKLSAGSPTISGKNADVTLDATADAIIDGTYGYSMSVGRFWYLP